MGERDKNPVQKRPRNEQHQTTYQQYEPELHDILGTDKITCKLLATQLHLRNQPKSGRKHELAKRLVMYCRNASSTMTAPENEPLAVTYGIVVNSDLDIV